MTAPQPSPAPVPPSTDLTGTTIGRYHVRALLGTGGQGEVYCADDLKLNRAVALKRLSPALRADERYRQRFLREAQRASGLNDSHIAGIYDVFDHEGDLLLVMEYVQGMSLRQRLAQPLPLSDFFPVAIQACEALIAAHQSGVVHRDIKPENIMLTSTGQVKVLDFGVAKRLPTETGPGALESTETKAGEISGTPAYMAPELLLHQESDARADIFSLGVVFYELLTGRHPFLVHGLVATVDRILHENPKSIIERNPAVPPALEQIVFKMLAKDPAKRYASAQELLTDLKQVPTGPFGKRDQFVWTLRRHRVAVASAIAIFIAVLGIAYGWRQWISRPPIFAERDWVLIADPENSTGQPIFNDSLREALTISLQQSQYVNVFPRQRIFEALERMKRSGVDRIDENIGRELCQRENVRVLLASSIRSSGDAMQITVRALRPDSGDLLFAESEQLQRKEQFFEHVDALAKRVRSNLGESTPRVHASSAPLEKVTTKSLEALQLYSEAVNAMARGETERVPGLLQSALKLDSEFAMAHAKLGSYYGWIVGNNSRAIPEFMRAFELRQGLSKREQYWIEGAYYNSQEQYDKEADSLQLLVNFHPDDADAHRQLAGAYYNLGQIDKGIAELKQALRLNPSSMASSVNLVLYLAQNNQPDEAIAAFQKANSRGVDTPYMHWGLGLAYLGKDKPSEARQEFQSLANQGPYRSLGELFVVRVALYEGKVRAALVQLKRATAASAKSPAESLQPVNRYLLGRTYLLLESSQPASEEASSIMAIPSTDLQTIDLISAGALYANAGNLPSANRVLARLADVRKQRPSSWNESGFHILQGEIALAQKDFPKAVESFLIAEKEYPQSLSHIGLARAYASQSDFRGAAEQWQKVLDSRGEILQNGFPPDLAIAHLELARSYRRLNNIPVARMHYQQLLSQWEGGDDLPARRRAVQELRALPH